MTPTVVPVSSDFVTSIPREHIPAVIAALAARLLVEPVPASAPALQPSTLPNDRALTAREAASLLRRRPSWIYRHAAHLPFVVKRAPRSRLLCSEQGIQRYLARR